MTKTPSALFAIPSALLNVFDINAHQTVHDGPSPSSESDV
jgi:hypothetical protein